jgi:zinc protease
MEIVGPYTSREDQGQTTKVVLKNGLTAIVREQYATPLVNITTLVKAGYFDEEDRISGISHVIEHMFFKGTPTRGVGEVARETKALGGSLNAYTDYDRTVYYTTVPASNAMEVLAIQADALWHSSFDAEELKREVEVVLQENNRKLDNPSAVATEKLYATAFQEHRMKRWRIGTPEGLRALTRDDLVAYFVKYYRPSNVVLTVVGAVDREKVLAEIVKLYGGQERKDVERDASPPEPPQQSLRYAWQRGAIQHTRIALGYHVPGALSDDALVLEVLASVLGTGRSSRLSQVVRDEKNLITSGSATFNGFRNLGFFELKLETGTPNEAATAALAEVESIKNFGASAEAVERAKVTLAREFFGRMETVEGIADELAYHEALGDWKLTSAYIANIQKVTPQRVVDAAKKYLTFGNLSVFEHVPESMQRYLEASIYNSEVLDKVAAAVSRRSTEELPVAPLPQPSTALMSEIVAAPRRQSILRGPDVYLLEDHRNPIVSFGIFFPGGRSLETSRNAGITELMLRSALRGTKTHDSAGIARRMENAGVRIQVVNEADFFGYILDGLSTHMSQALQVLVEILQQPAFDEPQVASERALQLTRIRSLRDDNVAYPVSLFMKSVFGEQSYALPAVGTEEGIGKLTGIELREWFRNNQRQVLPTIMIVGDTRGTALVAPLTDALTNEDLEARDLASMPRMQPASESRETVETVDRQQTALVYGFPGVHRSSNDRYALDLLVHLVSGLGGRFFEAIREKQGLAYTVRTANNLNVRAGALYTYTAFSPDKEAEVRAALESEFERLRKEGVTGDELRKAIEYAVGEREIGLQTQQAKVLEYARAVFSGAGAQSVAGYSLDIQSVSREEVKAVIDKYLTPAAVRTGIVRGK